MNKAIYTPRENRWGNGVLFYSGARLPDIGFPAIDGPLSSLRMKAYRRGLEDYEYCRLLARNGRRPAADAAIRKVIPVALAEALPEARQSGPPWATDVDAWYRMRAELAAALEAK